MSSKPKSPKATSPVDAPSYPPVNLVVPNTIESKMQAILHLARAVEELSKAVNGVNLQATIMNNVIHGADVGINIKSQ